jgi:hypothetical protein
VDRIPQLHLDVIPFASYPYIRLSELTEKIEGRLRLLAQGKPQGVFPAPLPRRLFDVLRQPIEPVGRAPAPDPLVRSLVIVIGYPVGDTLAGIGKGGKEGFGYELLPDRLPEPLDLPECHGMTWCTADMADALPLEHLLKPCLPPPGSKLPPVVRQDLSGGSPLADGSLDHLKHCFSRLLPEQPMPHDIAGVIVDDAHQVDRIHPFELIGEDIDLPQGVGQCLLEAFHPGCLPFGLKGRIAKTCLVDYPANCLGTYLNPFVPFELIPDATDTGLRVFYALLLDPSG